MLSGAGDPLDRVLLIKTREDIVRLGLYEVLVAPSLIEEVTPSPWALMLRAPVHLHTHRVCTECNTGALAIRPRMRVHACSAYRNNSFYKLCR